MDDDNKTVIVSTVDHKPYVWREVQEDGSEVYKGFIKDMLDEVFKRIDHRDYRFKQAPNGLFGGKTSNDGWNGILGDIDDGSALMGGAAVTVTEDREESFDFTKPFMSNTVNLLVKKPYWFDLGLGYLVRPFSSEFWIMLLVVLLLIGIVFFIIGKFSPYEWANVGADRDPRGAKNAFTLRNSYMFALSTLTWQGYREAPHSISGRIMAAFWFIFVLFTLIAYTCNLTAFFLARPEQVPNLAFKTYEELLESGSITAGGQHFGATQDMLRRSRNPTLRELWVKMNARNAWEEDAESAVDRIKTSDGNFVYFTEASTAEYWAMKECDLMMYGESLFPTSLAFPVKKGALIGAQISEQIADMKKSGYLDQLRSKYWKYGDEECSNIDGRTYSSKDGSLSSMPVYGVTLKDMSVAILLLFLGFIAAMVFLIVENIHYQVTKKGKKIERPKILNTKIFKPKAKSSKEAKEAPANVEVTDEEAGPSSDGLESVPLNDSDEQPAASSIEEGGAKSDV